MSRTLCTFPGRFGDLLWALPTVRAIAEQTGDPVDLLIAEEFASIVLLLRQQPYLAQVGTSLGWSLTPPEEWRPPTWPGPPTSDPVYTSDHIYHLGYRGWPTEPLPYFTYLQTCREYPELGLGPLDLETPWITVEPLPTARDPRHCCLTIGWSDCYFEMKAGLTYLLSKQEWSPQFDAIVLPPPGSRWVTEWGMDAIDWVEAAEWIAQSEVFLGDCSALHVLAVALGKPVVLYEPMEARWNPIFYPLGKTGRVRLVTGNDGLPTIDARHTADVLREVLGEG
jgi:hypothetical protein